MRRVFDAFPELQLAKLTAMRDEAFPELLLRMMTLISDHGQSRVCPLRAGFDTPKEMCQDVEPSDEADIESLRECGSLSLPCDADLLARVTFYTSVHDQ